MFLELLLVLFGLEQLHFVEFLVHEPGFLFDVDGVFLDFEFFSSGLSVHCANYNYFNRKFIGTSKGR